MLRFSVFRQGEPARSVDLSGAHLIGSDGVPVRADITFSNGQIVCKKRTAGPAGLALLWPFNGGGRMLYETTRLPERDAPYVLQIELLRGRLMRIAQKREDWGLYEFEGMDEIARQIDSSRDMLIKGLQANSPAEAAALAESGMGIGLHAAERLSAFHAEIFLNRRKQVGGFPTKMFGCTIDVTRTDEAYRRNLAAACDYIVIPFSWRMLEPKEQQYNYKLFDDWMDWAAKKRITVRGSGLVSFTHGSVPDWVYIWEHDFETIRDLVCEHVRRVIGRYGRLVQAWEVISGIHADSCFSFNFEQLIELTRVSAAIAKQMAPRSQIIVDLVMPWGEYYAANQRTIPPMLYAEMIVQGGINFDAFGVQFYIGVGVDGMFVRDIFQISSMLDRFAVYGKPLYITGVATPSATGADPKDAWKGQHPPTSGGAWHKDWSEELQRAWMRRIYHIALSKPFIDGITWRDLCDDGAHYVPHGGLLRPDGTPKPAFEELLTLRKELCGPDKSSPAPAR